MANTKRETVTRREKKVGNDGKPVSTAEGRERPVEDVEKLIAPFRYESHGLSGRRAAEAHDALIAAGAPPKRETDPATPARPTRAPSSRERRS